MVGSYLGDLSKNLFEQKSPSLSNKSYTERTDRHQTFRQNLPRGRFSENPAYGRH